MRKISLFNNSFRLLVLIFFSYLVLFGLSALLPVNLYFIPALLLIFYLPGLILLKPFIFRIDKTLNIVGLIGLIVLSSFLLSCCMLVPMTNLLPQSRLSFICIAFAFNFLLYILSHFFIKGDQYNFPSVTWKQLVPIITLTLITLAITLINPYAQNADGYLVDLKKTIECGRNMLSNRRIFVDSFSYIYFLTGIDYKILFRFLYPALFVVSTMPLLGYIQRKNSSKTILFLSMIMLIPPVILSEVNIIRPQSALIVCTIPSLLFSYLAIKEKSWYYTIFSLAFSLLAFLFHELAIILILSAGIAIAVNASLHFRQHKITSKEILLLIVILLPYLYIFWNSGTLAGLYDRLSYVFSLFHGINLEFWFIDSYKTMDGMELGWPGMMALFYYAYNGLILLFIALYLLFRYRRKIDVKALPPLIFYITVFFAIAEIMPRLGFFFIPNRAWVHLMLATGMLTVIICADIYSELSKILKITLLLLVFSGVGASIYITFDNVSAIYPEEKEVIHNIQMLPDNATIVSSQDNESLVEVYGDRNYIKIEPSSKMDKNTFDQIVSASLVNDSEAAKPDEIYKEIKTIKNGVVVNSDRIKLGQSSEFCETHYKAGDPVYFLYSYRKITGMNSDRDYLKEIMDMQNKDVYANLGYKIVHQDQYSLLLELR